MESLGCLILIKKLDYRYKIIARDLITAVLLSGYGTDVAQNGFGFDL